jgi:hypothetical protein
MSLKNRLIPSIIRRNTRARSAVLAVVASAAVFAFPSASLAAGDTYLGECSSPNVSCQTGTEVSGPGGADRCVRDATHNTTVCIAYNGDVVYVLDGDSDGNSALGRVDTPDAGSVRFRYCRNPYSAGTWARCNFDWVEATNHIVYGGVRYTSTSWGISYLWEFSNN